MRDPARIDRILERLRKYWKKYPDLHLAQIVVNAAPENTRTYYVEDDVIEAGIPVVED